MELGTYSMGIGDRFGKQGAAQLRAMTMAREAGVQITPVWNKSHREHTTIGSQPGDVRIEADAAVKQLGWEGPYRVDADHIGLSNVDLFMDASDFFTLDVADFTGESAPDEDIRSFVESCSRLEGALDIPGLDKPLEVTAGAIEQTARGYLLAVREAGRIYRHIEAVKGKGNFVTEVSMDETEKPQTPVELLVILAAIAAEKIPAQTIAPKFTGRFNKGVDYVGDLDQFAAEFDADLAVIGHAIKEFGLPAELKLSVHSGSDKFSLYPLMRAALAKHEAGVHLKTAGTTWLEEIIGLAAAGGDGLILAKELYGRAVMRYGELCGPYAPVLDIDAAALPSIDEVDGWTAEQFASALRHDQSCDAYDLNFRQLIHVAYKVAAEMGDRYLGALDAFEDAVAQNVTENIFSRHIKPLFLEDRTT